MAVANVVNRVITTCLVCVALMVVPLPENPANGQGKSAPAVESPPIPSPKISSRASNLGDDAGAGGPTLVVPTNLKPYPLVKVSVSPGTYDTVDWEVLYAPDITRIVEYDGVVKHHKDADGKQLTPTYLCDFTGPPGPYRVTAWITSAGSAVHATATITIPATPSPQPTPIPPDPSTAKFWVVGVFDISTLFQLPSGQKAIYASTALQGSLSLLGGYWKRFDTTSPNVSADGPPWAVAALKAGLPALVVVDSNGAVMLSQQMPDVADEGWVVQAVKNSVPSGRERRPTARVVQ